MNKEGETVAAHHQWQVSNHTYVVSRSLGCLIVLIGHDGALSQELFKAKTCADSSGAGLSALAKRAIYASTICAIRTPLNSYGGVLR
jgi:uncharacterized membrane protein YkgB